MMSVYMTEEEQLEAIKKWWQRNNTVITIIFSLILLSTAAYKYWYWHQDKVTTQASNTYEHLMIAFSNQQNKEIKSYANQLINDYSKTIYADAAKMTLAKLYVAKDNYEKATEILQQVATQAKLPAFKQIAKIRIARILIAQKAYKQALEELSLVEDKAYAPAINELKGDIYVAIGKYPQAIAAYKQAITEVSSYGMGNLFLEMKTNELIALNQTLIAADKSSLSSI